MGIAECQRKRGTGVNLRGRYFAAPFVSSLPVAIGVRPSDSPSKVASHAGPHVRTTFVATRRPFGRRR